MVAPIITLVNQAMEAFGELPITPDNFNGVTSADYQGHHQVARTAVREILNRIYRTRKDHLLKSTFVINTVNGQQTYTLSFSPSYLAEPRLSCVTAGAGGSHKYDLRYFTEGEARAKYVDFSGLTEQGKPTEWWLAVSDTPGDFSLYLNPVPDAVYTLKGLKYSEPSDVTATDITNLSTIGDEAVMWHVAAKLAAHFQSANQDDIIQRAKSAYLDYLAEDSYLDYRNNAMFVYQHGDVR